MRGRAVAAGLVADRLLGEPATSLHPVVWFGRTMTTVERTLHRDRVLPGFVHAGLGVAIGIGAGLCSTTTAATYVAVGGRALAEAAHAVDDALEHGDLPAAREMLPTLVGRDPYDLDEEEICRAVVESVAENTVDAIVAPGLWAMAAGAPGALGYRAVNTLDAMVGHRSPRYEHYGRASARLDDIANFVPARITAGLVALVRPRRAREVRETIRHDAAAHPSPNAGVAEAAFAAALGVQLGGESRYGDRVEVRPALGAGRRPARQDIAHAVRLSSDVEWMLTALALMMPW